MDSILTLFSQDTTGATLRQHLDDQDTDSIANLIIESLQGNGPVAEYGSDCTLLIKAILRASPEEEEGLKRRDQVLKGSVDWLIQAGEDEAARENGSGMNNVNVDETAEKLVNTLMDAGLSFSQPGLVQGIYAITDTIRNQRHPHRQLFALFSRAIVIVSNSETVVLPDSSEEIAGSNFKDIVLDRICTAPWNVKSVLPLASIFGDIEMSPGQLEMVIVKIMKQFKHVDATDLPILIYNLLLLSSKGHRRLVIRGMLEFFDRLDACDSSTECLRSDNPKGVFRLAFSELCVIESTVILHFSFAVKQDQELGLELLKHMKSGKTAFLSSFSLECLMTMARVYRFESSVLDYLKSSILTVFKDKDRMKAEPWISQFEQISIPPVEDVFRDIIKRLPFGLEQLTQSIVQCGVYIMDSMAPTSPWRTLGEREVSKKQTAKSPNEQACELGAVILAETFKSQVSARTDILDHIVSRIVTKSASTPYFLDLLEFIVRDSTEELEEHLPRIKESLDCLSFLSLATAVRLMAAVKEITRLNRPFRDSLVLILRKALFSKNMESRQVALSGFMLLLKPSQTSQPKARAGSSSAGMHSGMTSEWSEYSVEILGMLRRCLGQQGNIRLSLYIGLSELVETEPNLHSVVFEILQAQFVHFYDRTGTRVTPLLLEECITNSKTGGEPVLLEPLQFLMSGVVRSLMAIQRQPTPSRRTSMGHENITVDEQQLYECHRDMDRIILGLERAGLEDFELDKTSDFNMTTSIGMRNNMYASLLIGCYESSIEYIVLKHQFQNGPSPHGKGPSYQHRGQGEGQASLPEESADLILHLFGKMRKLHDIVREKAVLARGKKMGLLGEASVLGLECITIFMELVFSENSRDEGVSRLKRDDDFVYYITTVAQVQLSKLCTTGDLMKDSDYDFCRRLSILIVREFIVNNSQDGPKAVAAGSRGKNKTKSLLMVGIEALSSAFSAVQQAYPILFDHDPRTRRGSGEESHHPRKVMAGFLSVTLPQANGGHRPDQQAQDVVAWTTNRSIRLDLDSLAAAHIQFLQDLVILFLNEAIPLLKEAAGLLSMIELLSKYLSRTGRVSFAEENSDRTSIGRLGANEMMTIYLDQLIHWLVRLCCDQAADDVAFTKVLLSLTLQLGQECISPETSTSFLALTAHNEESTLGGEERGGASGTTGSALASIGFGNVTASSAVSRCPEAAPRLRLADDVLLTYGMNYGPQLQNLRDPSADSGSNSCATTAGMGAGGGAAAMLEDETARLWQLRREIGLETRFAMVTLGTSGAVTDLLIQHVDRTLEGLEWALGKLRYCELVVRPSPENDWNARQFPRHQSGSESSSSSSLARPMEVDSSGTTARTTSTTKRATRSVQELETEICGRIEVCQWILVRISQSCINQSTAEHLIRVLHRCYRVLTTLTKHYLTPLGIPSSTLFDGAQTVSASTTKSLRTTSGSSTGRGYGRTGGNNNTIQLPHGFLRVTQVAGLELSRHLYSFLSYFQMLDVESKARAAERSGAARGSKKKKNTTGKDEAAGEDGGEAGVGVGGGGGGGGGGFKSRQKAKILRESKLIPMLIYVVEQYERYVIQLSKKAKVNLTQFMRRSTARDFRIQIQRLGDLGLEDRYEEEQQHRLLQQQEGLMQQQHQRQQGSEQVEHDRDVVMADNYESSGEVMSEEREDDEEEALVRTKKRARR